MNPGTEDDGEAPPSLWGISIRWGCGIPDERVRFSKRPRSGKESSPWSTPKGTNGRWWILGVLCLSLLVVGLDNTILNVALPTLVRDLHASTSQLQWMVDAYVLVFAGLLLTTGSLSDRYGRRYALAIGLVVFGDRLDPVRVRRIGEHADRHEAR